MSGCRTGRLTHPLPPSAAHGAQQVGQRRSRCRSGPRGTAARSSPTRLGSPWEQRRSWGSTPTGGRTGPSCDMAAHPRRTTWVAHRPPCLALATTSHPSAPDRYLARTNMSGSSRRTTTLPAGSPHLAPFLRAGGASARQLRRAGALAQRDTLRASRHRGLLTTTEAASCVLVPRATVGALVRIGKIEPAPSPRALSRCHRWNTR